MQAHIINLIGSIKYGEYALTSMVLNNIIAWHKHVTPITKFYKIYLVKD